MAENEQKPVEVQKTDVARERIDNLKKKINALFDIAQTSVVKEATDNKVSISNCNFTVGELSSSNFAMVKMEYKNDIGAVEKVSMSFNVNQLSPVKADEFVKEFVRLAGKNDLNKTNNVNARFDYKTEITIMNAVHQFLNKPNLESILSNVPGATKENIEKLDPIELTKNMIFILPEEKIGQILEGKMSDRELEGLVKDAVSSKLFNARYEDKSNEKDSKKEEEKEEEKTKEEQEKENQEKEFRDKIENYGGEEGKQKREQARELLDGNVHERSAKVNESLSNDESLKSSFETLKHNMQDKAALESFGNKFSAAFMDAHGLPPVPVTVKTRCDDGTNTMGEFIDHGSRHEIEIYSSAVTDMAEFMATLAHELTHAVDAALHNGIQNNLSTDISGNGLHGEALALLEDLNWQCYQVNAAEQTARNGEQIGIDFLKNVAGNEYDAQIAKYQAGDRETQAKVDAVRENFPQIIANARQKLQSLNIPKTSKGYGLIVERINYLEERQRAKASEDKRYYANREKPVVAHTSTKTTKTNEQGLTEEEIAQQQGMM